MAHHLTSEELSELDKQLQDIFVSLKKKKTDGKEKVKALDRLCQIAKILREDLTMLKTPMDEIVKTLRPLLAHRSGYMRAATIRTIRYLCAYRNFSDCCWRYHCHFFIAKMFDVDKKLDKEKKQAIELMKALSKSKQDALIIPAVLVKGVVLIADNLEDPYRQAAVEILRELVIRNPKVVATSNGIKVLFNAILDPKFDEMADSLTVSFLYLMDNPQYRKNLRPKYDIEYLLCPFTQGYVQDLEQMTARWKASRKAILLMMKSWTGLVCLSNEGVGIKSLVSALLLPEKDNTRREIIFDTVIEILRGAAPQQYKELIPPLSTEKQERVSTISHLSVLKRTDSFSVLAMTREQKNPLQPQQYVKREDNIMMSFLAMISLSFIHNGLVDALLYLSKKKQMSRASQILQVILVFSDMLLPPARCLAMHDRFDMELSEEISSKVPSNNYDVEDGESPIFASKRIPKQTLTLSTLTTFCEHSRSIYKRKQVRMDTYKTQVASSMDEATFNQLLKESNVITQKDVKKWNWDIITLLVYGPLRTPAKLHECLKTKFIKRVIGYYKPKKRLFTELQYSEPAKLKFTHLCCQLIENLLSTEGGFSFLTHCKFLNEIVEILQIETQKAPEQNPNRLLSDDKVAYYMTRDYFTFLGTFSAFPQGVKLLQDFKIFALLQELVIKRDDICQLVVKNLDYRNNYRSSMSEPARNILKEALKNGTKKMRYYSTLRMRILLRDCSDFHQWGIELLNNQLSDPWEEVAKNALRILAEACQHSENLDALIALRPQINTLEHSREGKFLLLKFLSRPNGFDYLKKLGWVEKTRRDWRLKKNIEYVRSIEKALSKAMTTNAIKRTGLSFPIITEEGIHPPPHFYGDSCKTSEGCEMVEGSGDFAYFRKLLELPEVDENNITILSKIDSEHKIQRSEDTFSPSPFGSPQLAPMTPTKFNELKVQTPVSAFGLSIENSQEDEDMDDAELETDNEDIILLKKREALWTIGQIGSSDVGFKYFFEDRYPGTLELIVSQALSSPSLSFRGTCLYILSIMIKSSLARSKLEDMGWECHIDTDKDPYCQLAVCVPKDPTSFFTMPEYEYEGSTTAITDMYSIDNENLLHTPATLKKSNTESPEAVEELLNLHKKILKQVASLANPVTETAAKEAIRKYKSTHPEVFDSPSLLFKVFIYFNKYKYCLRVKQIIYDLFNNVQYDDADFELLDAVYTPSKKTNVQSTLSPQQVKIVSTSTASGSSVSAASTTTTSKPTPEDDSSADNHSDVEEIETNGTTLDL